MPRQVETRPLFKEHDLLDFFEILKQRHGMKLATEIMEVKSDVQFRKFCRKHGIDEGGIKDLRGQYAF